VLAAVDSVAQTAGQLVNCNEVTLGDRCACNKRILRALNEIRSGAVDAEMVSIAPATGNPVALQQERQHRLRTYYAPNCEKTNASMPPMLEQRTTARPAFGPAGDYSRRPHLTEEILTDGSEPLLVGRWKGWQTLFGTKPSPISLDVLSVEFGGAFVRACSDQGLVFGRVISGYLEVPRTDGVGRAYALRLWKSTSPKLNDLEGVVLLEARPGETLVAGLVWLSRDLKFDWTISPSNYFCQDRDLEEQRRAFKDAQSLSPGH